ncbi:MAG: inositol monophosphatase family protein [Nitrospinota bacterium]
MRGFVEELLREAGALALRHFRRVAAETKQDESLVSEADRAVELFLRESIERRFPDHRVLGEEFGEGARRESPFVWAVDPIDGTTPYLRGLPTWGVGIGLLEGGRPLCGGFFLPALGDLFLAQRGEGAWCNGERLRPLAPAEVTKQTVLFIPSSHKRRFAIAYPGKRVSYGSAGAHVAYTARGCAIAAVVDRPRLWDILGPASALWEVGGCAEMAYGGEFRWEVLLGGEKAAGPVVFGRPENVRTVQPYIEPLELP